MENFWSQFYALPDLATLIQIGSLFFYRSAYGVDFLKKPEASFLDSCALYCRLPLASIKVNRERYCNSWSICIAAYVTKSLYFIATKAWCSGFFSHWCYNCRVFIRFNVSIRRIDVSKVCAVNYFIAVCNRYLFYDRGYE